MPLVAAHPPAAIAVLSWQEGRAPRSERVVVGEAREAPIRGTPDYGRTSCRHHDEAEPHYTSPQHHTLPKKEARARRKQRASNSRTARLSCSHSAARRLSGDSRTRTSKCVLREGRSRKHLRIFATCNSVAS